MTKRQPTAGGPKTRYVVLDAMGVMYRAADDVADLLVPFVRRKGGTHDSRRIEDRYRAASVGALDPDRFWMEIGLDPSVENEYLSLHEVTPGLDEFLREVASRGWPLWCLSNDVARWSQKLRTRFGLERAFDGFVISAEIGARKPDPAAYRALLDRLACAPTAVVFFDDRARNVVAARAAGIAAFEFAANLPSPSADCVRGFVHALEILSDPA